MTAGLAPRTAIIDALARASVRDVEKGGHGWRTTSEIAETTQLAVGRARRHLIALAADGDADHDQDIVHYWRWPTGRPLVRFLDFDARREPKTAHFCIKCQRDLDPSKPFRTVRVLSNGSAMVVHPKGAQPADDEAEVWPIGNDCAAALGIFWSSDGVSRPNEGQSIHQLHRGVAAKRRHQPSPPDLS